MPDSIVVLVVEDDPLIQVLVEEALRDGGYEPKVVQSGEEALKLLQGNVAYRAILLDINLKGIVDGWEVARAAREANPTFAIVYMSGGSAEQWSSQGVPNSILLAKPFAPAQLVTAISNLLNGSPTP
jgi:DNA-binding response OmpR family regulator